ncbi:MAG: hypothetical protein IKE70_03955 [Bacilli bacterium]|nr:hypothetical protein [Bacilli bacterium]
MKKISITIMTCVGILFILIGFLLTLNQNVHALSKNDMTTLNLKRILSYSKPKNSTSLQASVITDKYLISFFFNNQSNSKIKNTILIFDKDTLKKAKLKNNPITKYNFSHVNDATYNDKTKEIYVLNGNQLFILDSNTLELKEEKKLEKKYHGIGYDSLNQQYVLASKTDNGTRFHIVSDTFQEISSFDIQLNLTRQGLTVHNGYIYYGCYEAGKVTNYQSKYDGVLKQGENVIYVYDLKGKNRNIFFIPYAFRGIKFHSIQNINFDGDKMIVGYNQNTKAGYFTPEYNGEITKKIKVSLDNQNIVTVDGKFESSLSLNGKVLSKVKNKGLYYHYSLKFNKEGNYTYRLKQTKYSDKNVQYDKEEKKLKVKVYYDPTLNSLLATTNSKEIIFTNVLKDESDDKEKSSEKEQSLNEETIEIKDDSSDGETIEIKEEKKSEETIEIKEENKKESLKNTKKDNTSDDKNKESLEPKVVEVPDTNYNSYIYLIGIVILGFNIFYIKKNA